MKLICIFVMIALNFKSLELRTNKKQIPQDGPDKEGGTIVVVGGGPVGLFYAAQQAEDGKRVGKKYHIILYESRIVKNGNSSLFEWKTIDQGNNRRRQVITLQSRAWSYLSAQIQSVIFTEGDFSEMWPVGPDSPQRLGYPRNIPIMHIENRMLALIQSEEFLNSHSTTIEIRPKKFDSKELKKCQEEDRYHVFVLADGGRSEQRIFNDQTPFLAKTPVLDSPMENILGVYFEAQEDIETMLPLEEAIAISINQNRYMINPLGKRKGLMYLWLTEKETKEVLGWDENLKENADCIQSRPCIFNGSESTGPIYGTKFLPSLEGQRTEIWPAVLEGLSLYGIPKENVSMVTRFLLRPTELRSKFVAELTDHKRLLNSNASARCLNYPFAFIIGDAAIRTSFKAGKGVGTGIKSLISLSRSIANCNLESARLADFTKHTATMSALQYREAEIRSTLMMQGRNGPVMKTVVEQINDGLESFKEFLNLTADKKKKAYQRMTKEIVDKCRQTIQRLSSRFPNHNENTTQEMQLPHKLKALWKTKTFHILAKSKPWTGFEIGGDEVDVDTYLPDPRNDLLLQFNSNRTPNSDLDVAEAQFSLNPHWKPNLESVFEFDYQDLSSVLKVDMPFPNPNIKSGIKLKAQVKVQSFSDHTLRVQINHARFYTAAGPISLMSAHETLGSAEVVSGTRSHGMPEFKRFLEETMMLTLKRGLLKNVMVSKDEPECVTKIKKSLITELQNSSTSKALQLIKKQAILAPLEIPFQSKKIDI